MSVEVILAIIALILAGISVSAVIAMIVLTSSLSRRRK